MLDNKTLFSSLSYIDDDFIEEGRKALAYGNPHPTYKGWKIALIAAILASLLVVSVFAVEWFGLSRRTSPPEEVVESFMGKETTHTKSYISMNGYADSPEALAHAEWNEFWWDYVSKHEFSNETDTSWTANELEEKYYFIYSAYNREMMDKLLEIQTKYNIRLHTDEAHPQLQTMIYETTGAKPFILGDNHQFMVKAVYEDGSFSGEGHIVIDGVECGFSVVRGAQGVLDPHKNSVRDAEDHTEWQYTNKNGDTVNLAMKFFKSNAETLGFYLFAQEGDYIVTIFGSCPNVEDLKASAESFADCFDIKALCAGDADLRPILNTKPTNVKPKEGLMTLKEFVETPEYKAASEFYDFYGDYCDSLPENDVFVDGMSGYHHYGRFPTGIECVDAELKRIINEYKLISPVSNLCYWAYAEMSSEYIFAHGAHHKDADRSIEVSKADYYNAMGFGQFSKENRPFFMLKYDNGAIWLSESFGTGGYELHYIPKGCFYPMLQSFYSTDVTSWAYESACGEQVWISTGEQPPYPISKQSSILYETDTAYVLITASGNPEAYLLEAIADNIDFTMFN